MIRTMSKMIEVAIDHEADAAYVRLSRNAVVETVELTDEVLVDLDEMRVVVGIEVLRLDAEIPYSRLRAEFHVRSEVVHRLQELRPSIAGFMARVMVSAEGTSTASSQEVQTA